MSRDRSIIVRLRAEVAEFKRDMESAAQAVGATATRVEQAASRSQAAQRRQLDTAGQLRVAEERLTEVQNNKKASSAQLAAAEEAVAKARRDHEVATSGAAAAERDLTEATQAHESASQAAAGAVDAHAVATDEAAAASQTFTGFLAENRAEMDALSTAAIGVGAGIVGLGVSLLTVGISYNNLRSRALVAMTAVMGSAEAATAQMEKLDEWANGSPFARDVWIQAQQQLIAFGFEAEQVLPILDALQEAVAATGGTNADIQELVGIIARIGSTSKITATDLDMFGRRGINAAKLIGDQMGVTEGEIRDRISSGTLDAARAIEALTDGMQENFAGAADGVKNSLDGAIDRVKAAFRDVGGAMAEVLVGTDGGGALVVFLNFLADMIRKFESLPDPIRNGILWIGMLGGALLILTGTLMKLAPTITSLIGTLRLIPAALSTTVAGVRVLNLALGAGIVGAVALGVTALLTWGRGQDAAKERADALTDALDQQTAAFTENSRAKMYDTLINSDLGQAYRDMGGDLADLIGWMEGDTDARERAIGVLGDNEDAIRQLALLYPDLAAQIAVTGDATSGFVSVLDRERDATLAAQAAMVEKNATTERAGELAEEVASDIGLLADAMSGLGSSMSEGFSAAGEAVIAEADRIVEDGLSALRVEYGSLVVATAESSAAIVDWGTALSEARAKTDSGTGSLRLFVDELLRMQKAQLNFESNLDLILANFGPEVARKVREQDPQIAQWMADDIRDNGGLITAEAADVLAETSALARQEAADDTLRMEALWRAAYAKVGFEGAQEMGQRLYDGTIDTLQAIEEYDLRQELELLVAADDAAARVVLDELEEHELEVELQLATESAAARADAEAERIRNLDPVVDMYGNIDPLAISAQAEVDRITALDPVVDMYGNIDPLLLEGDRVVAQIERYDPVVDMYGNIDPLASAANAEAGRISDLNPTMNISANTSWAVTAANNLRSQINGMVATIGIAGAQRVAFATGGPVVGPGTGTSDSIPAMLSNGEYVLRAATVQAAGGFAQVSRLVSLIESKGVRGYALGGPVQPNYARYTPPPAPVVVQQAPGGGEPSRMHPADIQALAQAMSHITVEGRIDPRDLSKATGSPVGGRMVQGVRR